MALLVCVSWGSAGKRNQQGMATLFVSVVVLMLAIVLVATVNRAALTDIRTSNNEYRQRQAFEAAEAGLNAAADFIVGGAATNPVGATTTLATGAKYRVAFCSPTTALTANACPVTPGAITCTAPLASEANIPVIVSCGWSDDELGRVRISQGIGTVGGLAVGPTNPLTSKGAVNVQGSATVTNFYNNLTVWSGANLSSVGNSGKTFVRNPLVDPPSASVAPPTPPNSCTTSANYVCVTDKNNTGPDVIDKDPTLSSLTTTDLFRNYTGAQDLADYKNKVKPMEVAPDAVSSLSGVVGKAIVVNGSISSSMNFTIGTRDNPVVLIVDGDWSGGGNTTVHGVVYVRGSVSLQGNKTIYGAAVVQGQVDGTGSLDLIYDPFAVKNAAENTGQPGLIPGSWRDFN